MRILIVGGGVSGLATAIALRRAGNEVVILERAAELSEVGAGVVLGPHAMRVMEALGAAEHIRRINQQPERMKFHDIDNGELRFVTEVGEVGKRLYGIEMAMTHRRDLIDALAGQLGDVTVMLEAGVVDVRQDEHGVGLTLADGRTVEGDLLIGTDGLRSTVRKIVFGESPAVFTDFLAWRAVVPTTNYRREFPREALLWMGSGRHVVSYPIRSGKQIYASFYVPATEIQREDWSVSGDLEELRGSFADSCAEVREIVEGVTQAFITGIFFRPPLDTWHRGRIVLAGDAAHPVLPTSGTGAGMALEDSVTLAACLTRHGRDHESAFAQFQARRRPRTTRVLYSSRADLQSFHESDPVRIAARASMNRGVMRLDPTGYARMAWQYHHDEVTQAAMPDEEVAALSANPLRRPESRRAFEFWRDLFDGEDQLHGWISERVAYERAMRAQCPWPGDVVVEEVDCDGVPALKVTPSGARPDRAVLHLHGGGHVFGSAAVSVALAADFARAVGGWALVPDFGLAPEIDAERVHRQVDRAYRRIERDAAVRFVSGEGSGAALAVALGVRIASVHGRQPAATYLLSPFVDASLASRTIDAHARTEPWLSRARLLVMAGAWSRGADPASPSLSPLHADLSGLAPMTVFAAADETMAGDAASLVEKAAAAGVDATLHLSEDSVHGFAIFPDLPESRQMFAAIRRDATARSSEPALAA